MYLTRDPSLIPKDLPRYSSATKLKYYPILGKHNDCVKMDFIKKEGIDEEEYESAQKSVVYNFANNTAQKINVGSIGDIDPENKHSSDNCMVELSSSPYTI